MEASGFMFALYTGDLSAIRKMLREGFDPDTRDGYGNLPIMAAASKGNHLALELLLKYGANPNLKSFSSSALSHAVRRHDEEMFHVLLNHHAKPSLEILQEAFQTSAELGRTDFMMILLRMGVNPNKALGMRSALFSAVTYGFADVVELLLNNGVDPNQCDPNGETVLMRLARTRSYSDDRELAAVKLLIARGADSLVVDCDGTPLLMVAAREGNSVIIQVYAELNRPLNEPDVTGLTPLEAAIENDQHRVVEHLLDAGLDPNTSGQDDQTPLVRTITGKCYQKKKMLDMLIKKGADPNFVDCAGYTAYERALQAGQKNLALVLQEFEPNLFQEPVIHPKKQQVKAKPPLKHQDKVASLQEVPSAVGSNLAGRDENHLDKSISDLNKLIGLSHVKSDVTELVNFLRIQKLRREKGLSVPEQSLHMVFTWSSPVIPAPARPPSRGLSPKSTTALAS